MLGHLFPKLKAKYTNPAKSYSFCLSLLLILYHTVAYTPLQRWKMPIPKQFLCTLLEKGEMSTSTLAGTSRNWTRPSVLEPFPFPHRADILTTTIREKPNQSCSFRLPSLGNSSVLWTVSQHTTVWDTFFYCSCFMFLKEGDKNSSAHLSFSCGIKHLVSISTEHQWDRHPRSC